MIKDIISETVRKRQQEQERIVKQAFLNHFGFPIDRALNDGGLSIVLTPTSTVQRFCYKGECFLIWDESEGLNVESGVNYWRGTLTVKYLFV